MCEDASTVSFLPVQRPQNAPTRIPATPGTTNQSLHNASIMRSGLETPMFDTVNVAMPELYN